MKSYPSIPYPGRKGVGRRLHTFAKVDGSNLRFEWTKKQSWYKFGTRRHLFDETFPVYGSAITLFRERLAEDLERVFREQRWNRVIVFGEFFGSQSLGGQHVEGDSMEITLLDVNPYKKGILPPVEFLKLFGQLGPSYLGYITWSDAFIHEVQVSAVEGASFEGVVGKVMEGKVLKMYKTKTSAWKAAILEQYGEERGRRLINS